MDSVFQLFERVENKHGWLLVSHALSYITASKNGVSEPEIEDFISLDDKVLDDIYQYHLPPTRRIPPLLWTRVRSDLPGYLADCEADGVCVINWYHKQFKIAARERYFVTKEDVLYFHSYMADYFLGMTKQSFINCHTEFTYQEHMVEVPRNHLDTQRSRSTCSSCRARTPQLTDKCQPCHWHSTSQAPPLARAGSRLPGTTSGSSVSCHSSWSDATDTRIYMTMSSSTTRYSIQ